MLLVSGQVALATVLLVGAGLLLRSFVHLSEVDPGFRPSHLIAGNLTLPAAKYPDAEKRRAFYEQIGERVRAMPGVEAAAVSGLLPFAGVEYFDGFTIEGGPAEATEDRPPARRYIVDSQYFETMGMPLVRGRTLQPTDRSDTAPVVVINASFARRYFRDGDPIGRRLSIEGGPPTTIVGVVGDVRFSTLEAEPALEFYFPLTQADWDTSWLVARTAGDPEAMIQSLRRAVHAVDPDQPLSQIAKMDRLISDSMAQRRLQMVLLGAFAALAVLLAATGLYGVLAHTTARRKVEIGLRLALGARPGEVVGLFVGKGMAAVATGAAIGLVGALVLSRVIASLLYGVSARDPLTFIAVPLVVGAIGLLAAWIPARRTSSIDPAITLRSE
jgi:putative ABC transport system permease protein